MLIEVEESSIMREGSSSFFLIGFLTRHVWRKQSMGLGLGDQGEALFCSLVEAGMSREASVGLQRELRLTFAPLGFDATNPILYCKM